MPYTLGQERTALDRVTHAVKTAVAKGSTVYIDRHADGIARVALACPSSKPAIVAAALRAAYPAKVMDRRADIIAAAIDRAHRWDSA
jgi:hypothetical protein